MMVKIYIVLAIVAALITIASLEQHFIQGTYAELERRTDALMIKIQDQERNNIPIDNKANIDEIESIYTWWLGKERNLSMLARHFDLSQATVQLVYAKNFIIHDNAEEALVGLRTLKYFIETHSFNIGTSVQNVI